MRAPTRCARVRRVRRTVLVVDDHAGFREMARALAVSGGLEVVAEAADGATALTLCQEHHPDLVLLDIGLPDLDGFDVRAGCSRSSTRRSSCSRPPGTPRRMARDFSSPSPSPSSPRMS